MTEVIIILSLGSGVGLLLLIVLSAAWNGLRGLFDPPPGWDEHVRRGLAHQGVAPMPPRPGRRARAILAESPEGAEAVRAARNELSRVFGRTAP